VANLRLPNDQVLLVQIMPGTSRISTAPESFSDYVVHIGVHQVITIGDEASVDRVGELEEFKCMFGLTGGWGRSSSG
jgi:hypothetical protein